MAYKRKLDPTAVVITVGVIGLGVLVIQEIGKRNKKRKEMLKAIPIELMPQDTIDIEYENVT